MALQHRGVLEEQTVGLGCAGGVAFSVGKTFPTNTEGRDVLNAGNNASKSLNPKGYGASTSTDGSVHRADRSEGVKCEKCHPRGVIRHAG